MRWLVKPLWQIGIDLAAVAAAIRCGFDIARKALRCYRSGGRFSGINQNTGGLSEQAERRPRGHRAHSYWLRHAIWHRDLLIMFFWPALHLSEPYPCCRTGLGAIRQGLAFWARPAASAGRHRNASSSAPSEGPPLGEYYCDYGGTGRGQVYGPGRGFYLLEGGRYHAEDDEIGTYTYDPATGTIAFSGGFFDTIDAIGEFKGGSYNQIDIAPADGVYTFCSLQ
ncbi:hypothetical protein [Mesorhizobium sp. KR1-2]|uniref:hypothetical protein n=1 Tax=Mesorhizobium sp. KR1-2 TaxID=3156609 RepID=UPI0032B5318C